MSIRPFNIDDVIATKDNRTMKILTVKYKDGSMTDVLRMEAMDVNAPSPMRTTIHWNNFRRVINRARKVYDPEAKRWAELQSDQSYKFIDRRENSDPHYLKTFKLRSDRRVKEMAVAK